ncbi:hypothetical protein HNQ80_004036 [Anaerosolibacter carboniphilus]|uniref:Uncharacterized protein n=1 Tax=Anaerosolibacter carboniphilus TaxID=1417629 RepID=A0A841L141_9FIRM|nr:hypothetical protein [Anaerosolibacter carboniphilus]
MYRFGENFKGIKEAVTFGEGGKHNEQKHR